MKMAEVQIQINTSEIVEVLEEYIDDAKITDELLKRFVDVTQWLVDNAKSFVRDKL